MKLVSDSQFDIRQYYGNLVILYPEKREELIAPLRQRLDVSGHVYYCCPVGPLLLAKGDAFEDILALLERCVCLVPVMTPDLVSEANSVSRAMFWHFIGYMKAKIYESVVPYIPIVNGEKLNTSDFQIHSADLNEKIDYSSLSSEADIYKGYNIEKQILDIVKSGDLMTLKNWKACCLKWASNLQMWKKKRISSFITHAVSEKMQN